MNEYNIELSEKSMNYYDIAIIFLIILFKYLINFGVSMSYLYIYLLAISILTILNLYNKKFSINEFNKIIVFLFISIYFVIMYRDVNFFISFLLSTICIRRKDRQFIKIFFISSIILYLTTIILNKYGLLNSKYMIRVVDGVINKRSSLGFTHPNEVFLYFIPIALCGYYLYGNKIIYYLILISVATMLYKISYSRTGYITIMFLIALEIFKKMLLRLRLESILPHAMVILTILSIGIAILYGNSLDNNISHVLSGRPYLWNKYIENGYMFSLLGNGILPQYIMDNFYLFLLVEMGLVGYIIYFIIYYKSIKYLKRDTKILIIILVFYIYGLTETNVIIGSIQFVFALQIKSIITRKKINKDVLCNERNISVYNNSGL